MKLPQAGFTGRAGCGVPLCLVLAHCPRGRCTPEVEGQKIVPWSSRSLPGSGGSTTDGGLPGVDGSHPLVTLPDGEYRKKGHCSTRRSRGQRLLSRRGGFKGWVEEDREDTRGLGRSPSGVEGHPIRCLLCGQEAYLNSGQVALGGRRQLLGGLSGRPSAGSEGQPTGALRPQGQVAGSRKSSADTERLQVRQETPEEGGTPGTYSGTAPYRCPPITFDNIPIPPASCVRYPGLYIDKRVTWNPHTLDCHETYRTADPNSH
ncbi:hypothetical protein AAG570_005056 [Ranatra chinensis]|uniref:Uncharacterized protein n=1 Tax=Ranatra chinensis TaxID=642074 RepID=A0ABD0YHP1_9HEMI